MSTIGRVIQGGPMIRIREDGETAEQSAKSAERDVKKACEAGAPDHDLEHAHPDQPKSDLLCDEPRFPPGTFNGWNRTRDFTFPLLRSWGLSEAEAWTLYHGQWQTYRNPLVIVVPNVVRVKAADGKPLLPHERRWLRTQLVEAYCATLRRKGREWFLRYAGEERARAAETGTLSAQDIEATAK